jgi:P27 family predicted phage terminase small subunit
VKARKMWRDLNAGWVIGEEGLPLLQAGLEQWDAYQQARAQLAADGPTFTSAGMIRVHPAAKVATDALREFRMCLRQLGLEPEA